MDWDESERRRHLFRYLTGRSEFVPRGADLLFLPLMRTLVSLTPSSKRLLMFERLVEHSSSHEERLEALRTWCLQQPAMQGELSDESDMALVRFAIERLEAASLGTSQIAERFIEVLVDMVYPYAGSSIPERLAPIPNLVELPDLPEERLEVAEALFNEWFRPIQPSDGVSEAMLRVVEARLGHPLPRTVRDWYARFGASELWNNQDRIMSIHYMTFDSDRYLNIAHDSECEVFWQIADLESDDPAVWLLGLGDELQPEAMSFSEYALQLTLSQIKWQEAATYTQNGEVAVMYDLAQELKRQYPECDVARSCWPSVTRWFAAEDLIVELSGDEDGSLWVMAKTREAARHFDRFFADQVEFRLS